MKELLFSLGKKDFRIDTFRSGGKGGQHQNKTNSGVRITHPESGAVGESREERSQLQNKKKAFERLVETKEFKIWHRLKCAAVIQGQDEINKMIEQKIEACLKPEFIITETRTENGWEKINIQEGVSGGDHKNSNNISNPGRYTTSDEVSTDARTDREDHLQRLPKIRCNG